MEPHFENGAVVKNWASNIDENALKQAKTLSRMPFIFKHVALMPDAHLGKGATVGSVIATKGAIIPSAVGVDIGCGMTAVQLPFKIDDLKDLPKLRHSIERSIPVGFNRNKEISSRVADIMNDIGVPEKEEDGLMKIAAHQLGTLGGGNHFIEICGDEENRAWIMLHSGSRHIGKKLADIHINSAKGIMKKYFIELDDPDLAFLAQGTPEFNNYIHDLLWAQNYASKNRAEMMLRVVKDISHHFYGEELPAKQLMEQKISCHHNYATMEHHFGKNVWVTRKGAVSAKVGEWGIIPGSMGTKSYIVKGLGNADSFCSCSHVAGRQMSRTKAKNSFTVDDLIKQTEGVECNKTASVLDEIPGAYKSIDQVMEDQNDLVEPVHTLKQILCVKG